MSILLMFPGQGSQREGMLSALPAHPQVAQVMAQVQAVLGEDPCRLETAAALQSTRAVQLCLLIAGVAMARVLEAEAGPADMVMGLSVGAYPAAVVAGVLDLADAVRGVGQRATLMEQAFPSGYGLTAVMGLDSDRLQAIVQAVQRESSAPVYLSGINSADQMVIAGADTAMATVAERARAAGAWRTERLAVRVPSHCPLLQPVALALRQSLAGWVLGRPRRRWISSSRARTMTDPQRIGQDLVDNVATPVNGRDAIALAWACGARLAIEMPSRAVLTGLARTPFAEGLVLASADERLETLCTRMRRYRLAPPL